ncbi:nucleotide sugar dehydrogenase [Deinococcus deserti]|uniref:Putative UDP-glucose/GDP-mannose dehydrogenase n=1 Tax=Deinococcus deserti (strain DSM 17065 / CIP 109153 / LMG 22923 / VCD115) TaxID=546414 RepID=C1CY83_DEIDV|nr:nucleotide sugar dehydrogenase [Deinococcus deserti]ACO47039.1 putative UDP-glucose/GDP-mannose dehydrogenase [Deinococcus deserti VCD115]
MSKEKIAVLGLGYVGLPLAVALAEKFGDVLGFDINAARVAELGQGHDRTGEIDDGRLRSSRLRCSNEAGHLADRTLFIVTVPTPIDAHNTPDLTPLIRASEMIGQYLKTGDVVVYESTVYPGVTEEVCGPVLARVSGLRQYEDFKLGYSPERINPGDKVHTLEKITKVVSGQDSETMNRVAAVYEAVVEAGIHRAPSIRVAEAAKVIENTQRDLNIALMNELALIFDRLGIRTLDVLEAAGTKWNFLPFRPGLVGGHCIGVDPYYLTQKAQEVGYYPQVILAGRRVNDGMGAFVAQKLVKLLIAADRPVKGARVGVLGLTFKENVPDLRNSRVPDIIAELRQFGIEPLIHDPHAEQAEAMHEYNLSLSDLEAFQELDGLILAVPHQAYLNMSRSRLTGMVNGTGLLVDVKSALSESDLPGRYWSL